VQGISIPVLGIPFDDLVPTPLVPRFGRRNFDSWATLGHLDRVQDLVSFPEEDLGGFPLHRYLEVEIRCIIFISLAVFEARCKRNNQQVLAPSVPEFYGVVALC
jgi:hypothetical protein